MHKMGTCNYRNFLIFHIPKIGKSVQVFAVASWYCTL